MIPVGYTPVSSLLRTARAANSVAFGLQGFFLAVVLTELPQIQSKYHIGDTLILVAVVGITLLAAVGSLIAEQLAVRWSSRVALRIGLGLIAVTGTVTAFAPVTAVLLPTLAMYGIALGIVDASTNMQAVFIQHGYGRFILSSFYAAWSAGSILGALLVSACEKFHVTLTEAVFAAALVVLLAGLALGPRLLGTTQAEAEPAEEQPAALLPVRAYLAFGIAMALMFAIDQANNNWSTLYMKNQLLASSATAALSLAVYQGAALVTRLTGDLWVRRFGPRAVVRTAAAIGVVGVALVVAAPNPITALAGFLIIGLGVPVVAPLCFSEVGRLTGGRGLDAVVARLNLFNYAGALVGGAVVGAVSDVSSMRIGFGLSLVFAASLILLARYFHTRRA
ncbi:MFS transporter [Nocardia alni]|uniref:MFS transporter n=1 Tax=Nocardia alni TaxID=2815723 RepID=UPI001C222703|nr:MFS transporter [Nocardia alni]